MALSVINPAAAAADTAADDDDIKQSINVFLFTVCQSGIRCNKKRVTFKKHEDTMYISQAC